MKTLICAIAISIFAIVGTAQAHCGACGVGDEAHAADTEKHDCSTCGSEEGAEPCPEACAEAKPCAEEKSGESKGAEGCEKKGDG